jgi:hypothetical protein
VSKLWGSLQSGLLTGLILAPFAIMDSIPNNTNDLNTEPVSKPVAIIFLIIGIVLTPLFLPLISLAFEALDGIILGPFIFFALIFIPLVVWGGILCVVIESFSYNKKTNKPNLSINVYQKLVLNLSKDIKTTNNIRTDFNSIIKSNVEIKQKIEKLNKTIGTYKCNLKIFGFIPRVKKRYFSKIKEIYREIHYLNTFNKVSDSIEEFNGYVYLDINTTISAGKLISLDKLAFANNSTIKSVVLPDSITTIEESAFAKCVNLESIVMNKVSVIKTSAFEYCENLSTLTLPTTLTKVEGYAFYGCEKLNNISYLGTALQWANVEINQTGNQVLNNTVFA